MLLVNNTRPAPLDDLRFFLDAFEEFIAETRVAIGITQTDLRATPSLDEYYRALEPLYPKVPLFTVDARSRSDVSVLLEALLCTLDPVMAV